MAENLIATEPLFVGRARAANPGDTVPEDNVKRFGWEDQVAREGSKAARDTLDALSGAGEQKPQPETTAAAASSSQQATRPARSS